MPLYVYVCPEYDLEIEEIRPIALADAPMWCPVCGGACGRGITNMAAFSSQRALNREQSAMTPTGQAIHRAGCACCTPMVRRKS